MEPMTYRELLDTLKIFTHAQLDMHVSIYLKDPGPCATDEFYELERIAYANEDNDVLDKDHPYLVV